MRGLLLASILIGLVAVSAPGLFTRYIDAPRSEPRLPPAGEPVDLESLQPAPPGLENGDLETLGQEPASPVYSSADQRVEIEASRDGHFYVDAEINFRSVRLMVDTGATAVALRQSDAARAGIRVHRSAFQHPVQTANGTTHAAEAMLDSVMVSDVEVRNVRALILPDDRLGVSLLGGTFLHGLRRFEVSDGTMILEK